MADTSIEKGDQVSWQWGSSNPSGDVAKVVNEGEASVESHRGNTITKEAKPDDPAVEISRSGNDVVKNASELSVKESAKETEKSNGASNGTNIEANEPEAPKPAENGEAKVGEKRDHEESETNGNGTSKLAEENDTKSSEEPAAAEEKKEEEPATKKQKTDNAAGEDKKNGDAPKKGRGRPKKDSNGTAKAPTKKREPKKAATESGEPRRSGRNSVSK